MRICYRFESKIIEIDEITARTESRIRTSVDMFHHKEPYQLSYL